MGLISELFGQGKIGLQCKALSGPELKRGWFAQNFQMTKLGFCIKVICRHHMTSHNFCGILKEIFKVVVVQQKHLKY